MTTKEVHQKIKWAQEGKGTQGVEDILRSYAEEVERETREQWYNEIKKHNFTIAEMCRLLPSIVK